MDKIRKVRCGTDLNIRVRLHEGEQLLDWNTATEIFIRMYADAQRTVVGCCQFEVDPESSSVLSVVYSAKLNYCYQGINRILLTFRCNDIVRTFDVPVADYVERSDYADQVEDDKIYIDLTQNRD